MHLYLATQNQHKADEFAHATTALQIEPSPIAVDIDENADSFIGNAQLKARGYARALHANTIADDSGLSVDALNGAPGIHSQRFAVLPPDIDDDPDRTAANNRKLLKKLKDIPQNQRTAHFTCALCLVIVEPNDIQTCLQNPRLNDLILAFDKQNREIPHDSKDIAFIEISFQSEAHGTILETELGMGGFGYDPLFYCPQTQCTFAELTCEQKLSVSHRGLAIKQLKHLFE